MPDRCLGVAENVILGNLCPLGTGAFELFLDTEACKEAIPGSAHIYSLILYHIEHILYCTNTAACTEAIPGIQTTYTENTFYIIENTFHVEHMLYTFGHGGGGVQGGYTRHLYSKVLSLGTLQ